RAQLNLVFDEGGICVPGFERFTLTFWNLAGAELGSARVEGCFPLRGMASGTYLVRASNLSGELVGTATFTMP
ncbi:MAG: hypothetical protein HKN32_01870, partial [Flavobacteriales bacterium]|nr:hypothetical protein [Flavobacteriales bacterium]